MSWFKSFFQQICNKVVEAGKSLLEQVGQKIVTAAKDLITDLGKKLTTYLSEQIDKGTRLLSEKMQAALDQQLTPKLTESSAAEATVEKEVLVPVTPLTESMASFEPEKTVSDSSLPLLNAVTPLEAITSPTAAVAA